MGPLSNPLELSLSIARGWSLIILKVSSKPSLSVTVRGTAQAAQAAAAECLALLWLTPVCVFAQLGACVMLAGLAATALKVRKASTPLLQTHQGHSCQVLSRSLLVSCSLSQWLLWGGLQAAMPVPEWGLL